METFKPTGIALYPENHRMYGPGETDISTAVEVVVKEESKPAVVTVVTQPSPKQTKAEFGLTWD